MKKGFRFKKKRLEKRHAKKSRIRKAWKAKKNRLKFFNKEKKNVIERQSKTFKRHVITVVSILSLNTNREGVLKFFKECKRVDCKNYTDVLFDFSFVMKISHGAITILLSICGWFKDQGISVSIQYPKNIAIMKSMEESGFLKYFRIKHSISHSDNEILQKGKDKTEPSMTAPHIHKAMKTVWNEDYKNTRLQGMLIEMMANTVNHAYSKYQKGWYFSVQHLPKENKVRFCFVDNGKGILHTVRLKIRDKIVNFFADDNDGQLLKLAFDGKFGSRTTLAFRGRGLPAVKKNHEQQIIKNLKVISNNVFLDFEAGTTEILTDPFDGTFYYWELDQTCRLWKLK